MHTSSVLEIIKEIQRANLSKIPLSLLEEKITRLFKAYTHTETVRMPPKDDWQWRFHRSIKYPKLPSHIKELSYPPVQIVKLGRANFAKKPVFYCSGDPRATFFELNLAPGDTIVLSKWRLIEEMLISHVGYSKESFQSLGSGRDCPSIPDSVKHKNEFSVKNQKINQFFSEVFTKKIEVENDEQHYNLTALIAKQFLILRQECGLAYPTVAMRANADNFVLTADAADHCLQISEAHWFQINNIQIDVQGETHYTIQPLFYADKFLDGKIQWQITTNEQKLDLIRSLGADSWS